MILNNFPSLAFDFELLGLLNLAQDDPVKRELIPLAAKLCVQNVYKYGAAIGIGVPFLLVD
jgi:hypothetical protein